MATSIKRMAQEYLLQFSNDFVNFRDQELESVCRLLNIETICESCAHDCPFRKICLNSREDGVNITSRCISSRAIYEYWCEGDTLEEILETIKNDSRLNQYRQQSFKVAIETCNRNYGKRNEEKLQKIDRIAQALCMDGDVDLNHPECLFTLFEYYGPRASVPTDTPKKLYFGKWIAQSAREQTIRKFDIRKRKFIGNTSMDPTLSLLMANMALVSNASLILDPFVGTGSLLLACAHYGGYACGTDINKVLLHGRGRSSRAKKKWREHDESVRANFRQYGMESRYIDVMVADASKHSLWRCRSLFEAIVTDPPYGIREQTKKLSAPNVHDKKPSFMPSTALYNLSDVFNDLLMLAGRCLVLGGRLVFWLPIYRPDYKEENIPLIPCFKLIANSEQILSTFISRRLITLEKISELDEGMIDNIAASHSDHYETSFRDRYFQLGEFTRTKAENSETSGKMPLRKEPESEIDAGKTSHTSQCRVSENIIPTIKSHQ